MKIDRNDVSKRNNWLFSHRAVGAVAVIGAVVVGVASGVNRAGHHHHNYPLRVLGNGLQKGGNCNITTELPHQQI